jgi:hypothetical protein
MFDTALHTHSGGTKKPPATDLVFPQQSVEQAVHDLLRRGWVETRGSTGPAYDIAYVTASGDLVVAEIKTALNQTQEAERHARALKAYSAALRYYFVPTAKETTPKQLAAQRQTETLGAALQANWSEIARSGLSNQSFERLKVIASLSDGWRGRGSRTLSAASLRAFLSFWHLIKLEALEPELMLTPKGTVQAEWHRSHRQFLDVEFRQNGLDANFAIFDRGHVVEATTAIPEAVALIKNYRRGAALRWGRR